MRLCVPLNASYFFHSTFSSTNVLESIIHNHLRRYFRNSRSKTMTSKYLPDFVSFLFFSTSKESVSALCINVSFRFKFKFELKELAE